MVGGEIYTLTIHVIQTNAIKDSFSLLLGRPWLKASEVVVNWGGDKPHISFGPAHNCAVDLKNIVTLYKCLF